MAKNRRTAFARRFSDAKSKLTYRDDNLFDLIDSKESDLGPGPYRGIIIEIHRRTTGRLFAWIRLLDTNEFQIPTACRAKNAKQSRLYKSMHCYASSKTLDNNASNFNEDEWIQREVEVTFAGGSPTQDGKMREAQFSFPPTSAVITKDAQFCYYKDDGSTTGKLSDKGYNSALGGQKKSGKHPYKDVYFNGAHFPYDKIKRNKKVRANKWIKNEYLPVAKEVFKNDPIGMRLLAEIHAIKEGFSKITLKKDKPWPFKRPFVAHFSHKLPDGTPAPGKKYQKGDIIPKGTIYTTRAYRCSNPGNIGNTDSGNNVWYPNLKKGIERQKKYFLDVANNKHRAYPIGRTKTLKPYKSAEIAAGHYGDKSPYLPGYRMGKFVCSLEQYVKVYATGSRSGNSYLSMIISYFAQHGITITEKTTIPEIIKITG
jgi:hypothetical protein